VARGLAHAHAEGVVHRDLKPSNVFVTNKGQVKILDFGMAHAFGRRRLSGGTPAYMAPEQWEGAPEDERTDVFALGVMLYRMLTGEYPFPEGEGTWAAEASTVRKLDVPRAPDLADLVEKLLDRTPVRRPRDGSAVLAALTPIEDTLRTKPPDGTPPVHARRRKATFGDLLAELKRRHVFRVMVGYGIFAFAVLQVTEPIMHGARLPDWVLTVVLTVIALGFPIAVVLAWLYDLTAHGVKRTPSATGLGTPLSWRSRFLLPIAVSAAVLAMAGAGTGAWFLWKHGREGGGDRISATAADPDGRVSVAVADFVNQTGDSDLDGLSGLLTAALEHSKKLRVLTRSRMWDQLRLMGKERAERIDEPLAREIGKRAGVRALLLASIRRLDDVYTVEMRAFDPKRDEYLFTVREQTSEKKGVLSLIDRLSERTRLELQEPSAEIRSSAPRTADVMTANLEANRHYFLGLDCMERPSIHPEHPESCLAEFQQAVALDPGFALAHYEISRVGLYEYTPSDADRAAAALAVRLAERLPRKERMLVRAWEAHLRGQDEDSRARYREVVAAFPEDKRALYLAGDLAFHRDDLVEAAGYFARVLDLDPTFEFALDHLSYSLAVLGRREDLAARVTAWSSMAQTPALKRALIQAWIGLGDGAAAVAAARRETDGAEDGYALPDLARALASTGDYQALEAAIPADAEQMPVGTAFWLAHARSAQGRRAAGLAVLDQLSHRPGERDLIASVHFVRALHFAGDEDAPRVWAEAKALQADDPRMAGSLAVQLARLGDMVHARQLAAFLGPGTSNHELYLAMVEAQEGHGAQARARLRAVEARNPQPPGGISPAFLRGELAAAAGLDAEAVEALRSFQGLYPLGYWRSWAWPRSLLLVARSLERMGRREEARVELDRFFRLWRPADAGLPSLAEATVLRAQFETGRREARTVEVR
jgi:tetratricopeptide (TPR) repeat protein